MIDGIESEVTGEIFELDEEIKGLEEQISDLENCDDNATIYEDEIDTGLDIIKYTIEKGNLLDTQIMEALGEILENPKINNVSFLQTLQSLAKI
jgi:hypothetical protein